MLNEKMFEKKELSELSKQVYETLVPEDHFFYKVNKLVDFSFVNGLCKGLYSKDMGRPAYPPEQIFRGAIAQFYFDLSDRKMEQEITFNIVAKWFIGLEVDDRSFDHSTISKFRTMLGKEMFDEIFYKLLGNIREAGCITAEDILIADATHIIADVAVPTVAELIRQGNRKVLSALRKIDPEIDKKIKLEVMQGKIKSRVESKKQLAVVVGDARALMKAAEEKLSDDSVSDELKAELREHLNMLRRLLRENVKEIQKEGKTTFVPDRQKDKLASLVDPDARNGIKSAGDGFCGYRANLNITQDMFILNARLEKGNTDESHFLIPMIDENEEHGCRMEKAIGDGKYGTYSNFDDCEKRRVCLVSSDRAARGSGGKERFATEDFLYDERSKSLTCPAGIRTTHTNKDLDQVRFFFPSETCSTCELREKCTLSDKGRGVIINKYYWLKRKLRDYRKTEEFRKDKNMREKVEAKIGEMKNFHGLARARYRGMKRVAIQLSITSMVVNLKRFVKVKGNLAA
ncbi:MAG: IS1182 family transposase [bacterium]